MPSKKVEKIAKDIKKLPPPGVAAVKIAIARTPEEKKQPSKKARRFWMPRTPIGAPIIW
jgi:hypothetical protein